MSATGSGITVISGAHHGDMQPVTLANGEVLVFEHLVGRVPFQVIVTDADGNLLTPNSNISGFATDEVVIVLNFSGDPADVYVSARWEENTVELDLIPPEDPRIEIVVAPT